MEEIINCGKIAVRWIEPEGWDVYATDDIPKGTILETAPFILFPRVTNFSEAFYDFLNNQGFLSEKEKYNENLRQNLKFKKPTQFYFKWNAPVPLNGEIISYTVIPLGLACIYNSSNTSNNAGWIVGEKTFTFKAERDISKGESIRTFYGYFLGELGQIFNCETVFNLALDSINGRVRCLASRFGDIGSFNAAQSNPAYQRLGQIFPICNGLAINKITALAPNGEEKAAQDVGPDAPMSWIYQKLLDFKNSNFPLIRITFEYTKKDTGETIVESIIFRK